MSNTTSLEPSEKLKLMLEEATRRVAANPPVCRGDPDGMSPETVKFITKRTTELAILNELNRMFRDL